MSKTLTARLPDLVVDEVQRLAESEQLSISEVVRRALVTFFGCDPSSDRHTAAIYETVKTRTVLLRYLDTKIGEEQVEALLAMAEKDAAEYVGERQGKTHAPA